MIERLASDVLDDIYFGALYTKAAKMFANDFFSSTKPEQELNEKELNFSNSHQQL